MSSQSAHAQVGLCSPLHLSLLDDILFLADCLLCLTAQVIALVTAPFLLEHPNVGDLFPSDAIETAKQLLKAFNGGEQRPLGGF